MNHRLEQLKRIEDPDEFIRFCRTWTAEANDLHEDELFPLPEEVASDIIEGFTGIWLALYSGHSRDTCKNRT